MLVGPLHGRDDGDGAGRPVPRAGPRAGGRRRAGRHVVRAGSARSTSGCRSPGSNAVRRVLPGVLKALGQQADLVERGRRATADLFAGVIKRYSFALPGRRPGRGPVRRADDREHADRRGRRVLPGVHRARQDRGARRTSRTCRCWCWPGSRDLVTPSEHSEAIADLLPGRRAGAGPGRRAPGDAGAPRGGHRPPRRPAGPRGRACPQGLPWAAMEAPAAPHSPAEPP